MINMNFDENSKHNHLAICMWVLCVFRAHTMLTMFQAVLFSAHFIAVFIILAFRTFYWHADYTRVPMHTIRSPCMHLIAASSHSEERISFFLSRNTPEQVIIQFGKSL